MKKVEVNENQVNLTWRNILENRNHTINHISEMAQNAFLLGYPLMLWNDRVYSVAEADSTDYTITETQFTIKDVV